MTVAPERPSRVTFGAMTYEPPQRVRPRRPRSTLDSPILAGALVLVVAALVGAIVLVPGVLPSLGPGPGRSGAAGQPTATPAGPTPVVDLRPADAEPAAHLPHLPGEGRRHA